MKNFFLLIIALAVGVGLLGYMRGWFNLQNDPATGKSTVVVDKEKWKLDEAAAKSYLKEKFAGLKKQAESATGAEKEGLEKQVESIGIEIAELDKHHAELDTASEAKLRELHEKLGRVLEKIQMEKAKKQ